MSNRTDTFTRSATGEPTWHPHRPIATVMDPCVPRVPPDAGAEAVLNAMGPYPQALVVDGDGKPLGLVDRVRIADGGTARQMMTTMPVSLHGSVPASVAASLMAASGTDRIAVLADDGRAVGLLTARDLLGWVAREAGHRAGASPAGDRSGTRGEAV